MENKLDFTTWRHLKKVLNQIRADEKKEELIEKIKLLR